MLLINQIPSFVGLELHQECVASLLEASWLYEEYSSSLYCPEVSYQKQVFTQAFHMLCLGPGSNTKRSPGGSFASLFFLLLQLAKSNKSQYLEDMPIG